MDGVGKGAYLSSPVEMGLARAISAISTAIRTRFIQLPYQLSITRANTHTIQSRVPRTWSLLIVLVRENILCVPGGPNDRRTATDNSFT